MEMLTISAEKSDHRECFSILHMFSQKPGLTGREVTRWNKMVSYFQTFKWERSLMHRAQTSQRSEMAHFLKTKHVTVPSDASINIQEISGSSI